MVCLLGACGLFGTGSAPMDDGHCPITAGSTLGWGTPNRVDDFTDPAALTGWTIYDGPGHAGNGRRTPTAVSVADGMLKITGDVHGNSGGMGWLPGQLHGRWETCIKSPPGAGSYHSLAQLWPDAEDWPTGGEIDFMEIVDPARQAVESWLHWGPGGEKDTNMIQVDATEWHSYAVEWTASHLIYYVDGEPTWLITDATRLPPRPMHLCIQLDYFGGDTGTGAQQMVDWVRQYDVSDPTK
jgi:licheninase